MEVAGEFRAQRILQSQLHRPAYPLTSSVVRQAGAHAWDFRSAGRCDSVTIRPDGLTTNADPTRICRSAHRSCRSVAFLARHRRLLSCGGTSKYLLVRWRSVHDSATAYLVALTRRLHVGRSGRARTKGSIVDHQPAGDDYHACSADSEPALARTERPCLVYYRQSSDGRRRFFAR